MALAEDMRQQLDRFTSGERKAATAVLADFPFAGLMTVAELAARADVSGQTILRFVAKLGYASYGAFQKALIGEIKEGYHSPIDIRASQPQPDASPAELDRLADRVCARIRETTASLPARVLDTVCERLSDRRRAIYLLGGRMSDHLAGYLTGHLRQIRPKVYQVPRDPEAWPEYLLRMSRKDLLVMFDFRRYEPNLLDFAARAADRRGAEIVLFTDKWLSPVARHSAHILPAEIDSGTAWDTVVPTFLLMEAVIARVADADWDGTQARIQTWDRLRSGQ